jgi:amidase
VRTRLKRCESLSQDPESVKIADLAAREAYRAEIERAVPPGTVVVLPVVPERGPKIRWDDRRIMDFRTACFRLSAPSSLSGAPQAVLSVPVDATNNSMGIGLFTAAGGDHLLLDLMAAL